jgi:hypothetical protein
LKKLSRLLNASFLKIALDEVSDFRKSAVSLHQEQQRLTLLGLPHSKQIFVLDKTFFGEKTSGKNAHRIFYRNDRNLCHPAKARFYPNLLRRMRTRSDDDFSIGSGVDFVSKHRINFFFD